MLRAQLGGLSSPDLLDIEEPDDPSNCWLRVVASIAMVDESDGRQTPLGESLFYFNIVTTLAILEDVRVDGFSSVPKSIIVEKFTWKDIEKLISDLCARSRGHSESDVAKELTQYADWEYSLI